MVIREYYNECGQQRIIVCILAGFPTKRPTLGVSSIIRYRLHSLSYIGHGSPRLS